MAGLWRRMFGNREPDQQTVSPEVREALDNSARRLAQARRIRRDVDRDMVPINILLDRNGFEPAVRETFVRRAT